MEEKTLNLKHLPGGVTAAKGFRAGAAAAAVKRKDRLDVAVIYSTVPAAAAGIFTLNKVKAAPLLLSMKHLAGGRARAVVANSGNANACNGTQGWRDALAMAAETAEALGISEEHVLVASTGVIGKQMPLERVLPGIRSAAGGLSGDGGALAARAIMTTDTYPKEVAVRLELGGREVTVGGMAKGSGMVHPNLATMLAFVTTDAAITPQCLKQALEYAGVRSFNMITVDGDTSTNDMAVIMANGRAGNPEISGEGPDFTRFREALTVVCTKLAVDIARDGEGATRLLEVEVRNAATREDARFAARTVAGSNLVKAAIFGRDANWGRILCAAGYSGANFTPDKVDIFLGGEQVARNGGALAFSEERAGEILGRDRVKITIDFKEGNCGATAWGCDLSYDYVRINADYRT
jgi:glutamate N-acetyltransferase/amino-acid N-acetyltransferase